MKNLWMITLCTLISCGDDAASTPDTMVAATDGGVTDQLLGDTGGTMSDTGGTMSDSGGTMSDSGGTVSDGAVAAADGGGSKTLSCGEIGTCSDTCSNKCPSDLSKFGCMLDCSKNCKAQGCATAQPLYQKLYECINANCIVACMGGPSAGCKTCVTDKCKADTDTCNAHTC